MRIENLKQALAERRSQIGMTQKELASKLGKAPSTYNEIEQNLHSSSLKQLQAICDELRLTIVLIPTENL